MVFRMYGSGDPYTVCCMTLVKQHTSFFKIRIASGEYQGFYVGATDSGVLTGLTADEDRALSVNGFSYMLYTQETAAIIFGSSAALQVQAELRDLGIDSELI